MPYIKQAYTINGWRESKRGSIKRVEVRVSMPKKRKIERDRQLTMFVYAKCFLFYCHNQIKYKLLNKN